MKSIILNPGFQTNLDLFMKQPAEHDLPMEQTTPATALQIRYTWFIKLEANNLVHQAKAFIAATNLEQRCCKAGYHRGL